MVGSPVGGVFGQNNARLKTPVQVAEGFVPPPQYWQVAPAGNTVLVGPRGSGKTTLLKMLQSPGLEHWADPEAERARDLVTYSGVFVPADRSWSGQVDSYGRQLGDDALRTALGSACFTLHLLRGLTHCAGERIRPPQVAASHDRVELDREAQERIVRDVWQSWALPEPVGSFAGLGAALSTMLSELGRLARRAMRRPDAANELSGHPALDLEIFDAVVPFVERFNHSVGQEHHIWAFLIDEIEFLPQGIQGTILNSMRGRDPRLTQKVSLAPYTLVGADLASNPLGGWEGHDLETVELTFSEKEDGYPFSRALVEKELEAQGKSPEDLLGEQSFFEMPPGRDAYKEGSRNALAIASLATQDPAFREWLDAHNISADRPWEVVGNRRAGTLRKAMPVILLREAYLHEVRSQLHGRSRKAPRTYVGEKSAYAICENNPRLLQALVSRLLARSIGSNVTDTDRVSVLEQVTSEYELHLRALEVPEATPAAVLPRTLVKTIGEHFESAVFGDKFDPEPPLSFDVSSAALRGSILQQVLSQLVHYGAVVPSGDDQFRLAHTFAPSYRLPLRKGRAHALRSIIGDETQVLAGQMSISDGTEG